MAPKKPSYLSPPPKKYKIDQGYFDTVIKRVKYQTQKSVLTSQLIAEIAICLGHCKNVSDDTPLCEVQRISAALLDRSLYMFSRIRGLKIAMASVTVELAKFYFDSFEDETVTSEFWSSDKGVALIGRFLSVADINSSVSNSADSTLSNRSISEIAFEAPYVRPEITAALVKHCQSCLKEWDRNVMYSPYAAVINASMMGQSRAFQELPVWGIFLFNICFQKPKSGNFPQQSAHVADWFSQM